MVRLAGSESVGRVGALAAPWLPLVLALEGLRILLETSATRALYGDAARNIPRALLLRAHLVGYAMTIALPAGRTMAEGYKAAALVSRTSPALSAAVATANQSLALFAVAALALPCALASYLNTGFSALTMATLVHLAMVGSTGTVMQLASRNARLSAFFSRISPSFAAKAKTYREACNVHGFLPLRPFAFHVASRAIQVAGLGLLLYTVSTHLRLGEMLMGQSLTFVGGAAGDLIPFQLGATDGAWALGAPRLHLSVADAVGVALLAHGVQVAWSAVGALVPVLWRAAPPAR